LSAIALAANDAAGYVVKGEEPEAQVYLAGETYQHHLDLLDLPHWWQPSLFDELEENNDRKKD
jgi:hypothetical protein